MAMRFNKKIKLGGATVNLNKKSASVRIGGKHAGVTFNTNGQTTRSASIPGTGVSFRSTSGGKSAEEKDAVSVETDLPLEEIAESAAEEVERPPVLPAGTIAGLNDEALAEYSGMVLAYAKTLTPNDGDDLTVFSDLLRLTREETEKRAAQTAESPKKKKFRWYQIVFAIIAVISVVNIPSRPVAGVIMTVLWGGLFFLSLKKAK